jgi:Family of unknown function (DUF5670)
MKSMGYSISPICVPMLLLYNHRVAGKLIGGKDDVRTIHDDFMMIAFLLLLMWAGGFLLFHVASGLIHLLLLFAVISFVVHLLTGTKTA